MIHQSTCYLNHTKTHRGPFAGLRSKKWRLKHMHPVIHECDTCQKKFDREPEQSNQTYNGQWFCSDVCSTKAGW